jgi:5-deoxy-D-glucuronate isomerase
MARDMDSGTEFALQALQGQIKVYTDTVREKIDGVASQLKEHCQDQKEWQERVESDIRLALAYGPRIEKLERQVCAYEEIYQKSKGIVWASRAVWAVLGVVVSALLWAYAEFGVRDRVYPHADPPPSVESSK